MEEIDVDLQPVWENLNEEICYRAMEWTLVTHIDSFKERGPNRVFHNRNYNRLGGTELEHAIDC